MNIDNFCLGCMQEIKGLQNFCPKCGRKVGELNSSRGLQPKTILNGKYIVGRVIGEGGFGITYIAYDQILNYRVAIKEYFPSDLVSRNTSNGGNTSLTVLTGNKEEQYKKGIERFIKEASNLAKFNNLPGIVSVKEFFYENNTAYMVMEYVEGITLSKYLDNNGGRIPYTQVLEMMNPIMESLEKIHASGIIHRDISPDNIMITSEGKMKLIDFGASRFVDNNDVKSLTVILKHGYAPEEQYQSRGNQGPWTDIYALSATMYRMITGIIPQESTDRILSGDKVVPVNKQVSNVSKKVSDAIMHGLAIKASNRPQNISEFKKELIKGRKKVLPFIFVGTGVVVVTALLMLGTAGAIIATNISKKHHNNQNEEIVAETPEKELVKDKNEIAKEEIKEETQVEILEEIQEEKDYTEEELITLIEQTSRYDVILDDIDKNTLDLVMYNYEQINLYLSYHIYEDFDGDGKHELFAYICTGPLEDSYINNSQTYSAKNTELWFSDGANTFGIDNTTKDYFCEMGLEMEYAMPCGLSIMRFGSSQDVCEMYSYTAAQDPWLVCQTYQVNDGKVEALIKYSKGYDNQLLIGCDSDNNPIVFLLDGKCMSYSKFDSTLEEKYKSSNWKAWDGYVYPFYYIYKFDNKYYIYSITEQNEDFLRMYDNYEDIINNIEQALYQTEFASAGFQLYWDLPYSIQRKRIYLSDNDKVYVNYYIQAKPNVTPDDYAYYDFYNITNDYEITAVFSLKNNSLYLDGFFTGWMDNNVDVNGIRMMDVN